MVGRRIVVKSTEADVVTELCNIVQQRAKECLSTGGGFHLGVSGGSLAKFLCQGLPSIQTDWARWKIFFCDERLVPADNSDSTWGLYRSQLLSVTPLKEDQFITVNTDLEPSLAAKQYQEQLEKKTGLAFHLLLLGAGPDGHTCSLFPGHVLMDETAPPVGRVVAHITDSPKPPPARVTLTLPAVNSAELCVFAATGSGKAAMMKMLLGDQESDPPLPARLVNPLKGEVVWILDSGAAAELKLTC